MTDVRRLSVTPSSHRRGPTHTLVLAFGPLAVWRITYPWYYCPPAAGGRWNITWTWRWWR